MSEEQKEHEAMKLANLIDRLHSMGIVKPGKLGKFFRQIKHAGQSVVKKPAILFN